MQMLTVRDNVLETGKGTSVPSVYTCSSSKISQIVHLKIQLWLKFII